MTWRELDERSDCVARWLTQEGVKGGEFVAVMAGRTQETLLAVLAIWKAGAAYVFLDREYPESRNRECREDCGVRLVLTREVILQALALEEEGSFEDRASPDGVAVVVYTSGTTAKPKGVLLTHKNVLQAAQSAPLLGITREDRYGCFASLMFVASVYDIAACLWTGCTLCLIPREIRKDIRAIAAFYREQGITVTFLPPHMALKYQALDEGSPLRALICGSAPARNLERRPYRIFHVYAMSEACGIVSLHEIQGKSAAYPLGKPLPGIHVYILGEDGKPVPDGETGELALCGPQISPGYLHEPEANRIHFRKNPFKDQDGCDILFYTGDLVAWGEDGELIYHGRGDDMVKIRGFRIELAAVENCIQRYPGIQDACCVAHADGGGEKLLFGYFVADHDVDHEALRAFMLERLPYYMAPTGLIQKGNLPRNANGKLDRHAFNPPPVLDDYKRAAELYR